MNQKIRDLIAVFLIQLVLTLPFYTANVYGLTISNARVTNVASNSATVEWNTDNISNGRVRYGQTTALGFTQRHDNFIANHTVALFNGINSDTNYFFIVESTDLAGNTAIDNNSNNFYTFRTTDITPPPQVTGLAALSTTSSSIFLTWTALNITDLNHYVVYRNRVAAANTTANSFNDTGLAASTSFSYKVSAVDNSGNEGPQSDTVIASTSGVDSLPPTISNADALPLTDTTARITWLTDENSTTIVLYGINKTDKAKSSSDLETNHTIVIDGLTKNKIYTFIVKSCDSSSNCANSSNQSFVAGKDLIPPFINLSIPRYANRRVIDIAGSTEPFSSVTLFVNNMNIPKRSLSSNEVGVAGKFIFSSIQLEQDNLIKVVFVDKSGNKNQKIFEVSIDTEDPIVQLNELPSLTSKSNISISGSVNEPVTIKVFVDSSVNKSLAQNLPSKVTGLNTTKISQNSVEIHWDESKDKDFSHYVVYRADASPIAITKPANFNFFIDALVDSGRSYTYQVSAVDIFANEGPLSEPITVTALKGGAILNLRPQEVDILEDFRKAFFVANASGSFNFGIRLNKGDGTYNLKIIFEDRAGNIVIIEKVIVLDTKKPEVKIISPPSGALIFENAANEIDVVGKTKPNARVHLFVDRTPFSFFNQTLELSGLPNEVQNIPEAQLDAKCRFNVAAKSFCRTGADFSVDADSEGNFKFEKVDLTALFGGAGRIREVPVTEFRDIQLNPESRESKKTTLVVIATDATGQRGVATQSIRIGTCWSGNQSWDIIPLSQYQSPTLLSTERLAEGTETIYFYFNYSYIGRGTSPIINGITISKACGTRETLDPRFNISCQILSGVPTQVLKLSSNPAENRVSYSAAVLSRFPGMDKFLEGDWKSFFKAISKEMTFPLLVRINYKHDTNNDGVMETETQTICEQVSYTVDNTIIDPRKVLPDWLLFDFVNFLQDSIKTLTDVQEKVNKLVDYVAVGCFASGGAYFVIQIYRRWNSFWEEKAYAGIKTIEKLSELFGIGKIKLNPEKKEYENDCQTVINNIVKAKKEFKLKYVNDIDLRRCFPTTASAWDLEAKTWKLMRYSCDRIFGHSAPSRWTEAKEDEELIRKAQSIKGCAGEESALGQPLKAESCGEFARRYPRYSNAAQLGADKQCVLVRTPKTQTGRVGEAVFTVGELVSDTERLYKLDHVRQLGDFAGESFYAVKSKVSEFDYVTAQSKSCEDICGAGKQGKRAKVKFKGSDVEIVEDQSGKGASGKCMTVQDCTSLNAKDPNNPFKLQGKDIKYARNWGFTSNCFYDPDNRDTSVVSDNPAQRVECCCINTQDEKGQPTNYYQPDDVDPSDPNKKVHESKTKPGEPPQGEKPAQDSREDPRFADMKFSYRYSKEKFQAISDGKIRNQYHPNRYIEERDFPACFGQNHFVFDNPLGVALGEPEKVLMLDPSKDYVVATFQCAHLAGISQRLQFIRNLMSSLSTCLIQVRTTGRGDAGACKELFTQYLCNSIWQVINFLTSKGCAATEYGDDPNIQSEKIIDYVRAGIKSVSDSASDLQSSISQEYGNAKLNDLLGSGEESIARKVCLAAFGYDWELNVRNLIDAAYTTPFATLVQPITRSREFLTIDPVSLKPKYEYRASWLINPGCDFERYDIELACVGKKQLDIYPNQVNCGAVGAPSVASAFTVGKTPAINQCDCIGLPDEKRRSVFAGTRLKQNVLEDNKAFHQVIDDNYRYDHLKFTLRTDRKIPANIKPNCFPTGYDDGIFYVPLIDKTARDIFECRVDPLSGSVSGSSTPCCYVDQATGSFTCGSGAAFASRKGTAEFIDIKINDKSAIGREDLVFTAGETLKVDTDVRSVGQNKCLRMTFDGQTQVHEVFEGIQQYTLQTQPVTLGTRNDIVEPAGIKVQKINLLNQKDVFINLGFWDTNNNLYFFDDEDVIFVGNKNDKRTIKEIKESAKPMSDGSEVSFANQQIIIKKDRAEVVIISVEAQRNTNTGQPFTDIIELPNEVKQSVPFVQGTIRVLQPTGITDTTQPQLQAKTLTVGLYHTRDDPNLFGVSSCDFNDPVITITGAKQERNIRVSINQKPVLSALQAPIISGPVTRVMLPFKKDNILILATITHSEGLEIPEMECRGPDTSQKPFKVQGNLRGNNNYEFYVNPNDITYAGEYACTLIAKSRNRQARENSIPVRFEVQCGGDNNVYNTCDKASKCKSGNIEVTGLPCFAKS